MRARSEAGSVEGDKEGGPVTQPLGGCRSRRQNSAGHSLPQLL